MPQTVEVPFRRDDRGRYLTRVDIEDNADGAGTFYLNFKHRFEPDYLYDRYYLIEDEDAQAPR